MCDNAEDPICLTDSTYLTCVNEVRLDLITTTAAIAALSSFFLGLLANLPVGMAPGLGVNAYVRSFTCSLLKSITDRCRSWLILSLVSTEVVSSPIKRLWLPSSWKGAFPTSARFPYLFHLSDLLTDGYL